MVDNATSDIVVTGRGASPTTREAATVTSLGSTVVAKLGITKVSDLTAFAPGLFQPQTGITPSHTTIFIRGIGELDQQGKPSIGVYADGVYIPRTTGSNLDLLDIETIDVARGPQGFLFGHSAEGGAISIRTTTPGNDTHAAIQLGYGSYNEIRAGAAVSGPIVKDKLYASVAIEHRRRDGITDDLTTGEKVNKLDSTTFRAKLRFTPTERLDLTAIFDGTLDYGDAKVWGDLKRSRDPNVAFSPIDPKNLYRQFGYTLQANYEIDDNLRLVGVGGFRNFTNNSNFDNTGDTYGRGIGLLGYHDNFYTTDIHLQGDYKRLTFSVGGYFARESWLRRGVNNGTSTYTLDPNVSVFKPIWNNSQQQYNNFAGYAQGTYEVVDRLKLTLGARLNYEKQYSQVANYSLGPTAGYTVTGWQADQQVLYANQGYLGISPPPGSTLNWTVDEKKAWTRFTPKAALEFVVSRQLTTYVSVSQGTRDGGFDYRGISPALTSQTQNSLPFAPEKVTTYEGGFRSSLANGAVHLSSSIFYNDFKDIQLTTLDPVSQVSRRFNAGNGRSWGAEGELQVTPVHNLNLGASASYLNAKLTKFAGTATSVTYANGLTLHTTPFAGARLPDSPHFQGQANADYTLSLHSAGSIRIGGDVQYRSHTYVDALENAVNRIPRQTIANAFISYTEPSGRLTLRVDARNLFDKQYAQWKSYTQNAGTLIVYSAMYNDPRSLLGTLNYKF